MFRSRYESALEQLRKCYGAVSKCSGAVGKSSVAVISLPEQLEVFRNSYKSSVAAISLPEQL